MSAALQPTLFAARAPSVDPALTGLRRITLGDGAWVDHLPGWVQGHDALFEALRTTMRWRSASRPMYDRVVDVPRLLAVVPEDGSPPPIVGGIADLLSCRYGIPFDFIHMAYYRDGNDSVAMHGDRVREDTIVPIVSVGTPRRFTMRHREGRGSKAFSLGWGDLFVMGGTCQSTWHHGVPKARQAEPRISILFRSSECRTFSHVVRNPD